MIKNSREEGTSLYMTNFIDISRFVNKESLIWKECKIIDYKLVPTKGVYGEDLMRIDYTYESKRG